jgi:hypothetical protein
MTSGEKGCPHGLWPPRFWDKCPESSAEDQTGKAKEEAIEGKGPKAAAKENPTEKGKAEEPENEGGEGTNAQAKPVLGPASSPNGKEGGTNESWNPQKERKPESFVAPKPEEKPGGDGGAGAG